MYHELLKQLNVFEKVLFIILKNYSIKVYKIGIKKGYNWDSKIC